MPHWLRLRAHKPKFTSRFLQTELRSVDLEVCLPGRTDALRREETCAPRGPTGIESQKGQTPCLGVMRPSLAWSRGRRRHRTVGRRGLGPPRPSGRDRYAAERHGDQES